MIYAYLIFQAFALFALFMWWHWWSGRSTVWLQGRKRGWFCFLFLTGFAFAQSLALGVAVFEPGTGGPPAVDSDLLRLFTVALMFLGTPTFLLFTLAWAPRFALPGWIRERLAAGDPVRTAQPLPEVQHLMTKPQNAPPPEPTFEQLQLPTTLKVGLWRWWFGAIVCGLCAVLFGFVGLDTGGPLESFGLGNVIGLLLAAGAAGLAVMYARHALRPEHLYFTETGIETRNWSLAWTEITGVSVSGDAGSHKGQVLLEVTPDAHRRVEGKGWSDSALRSMQRNERGEPGESPQVALQPATKAPPAQIAALVQSTISHLNRPGR